MVEAEGRRGRESEKGGSWMWRGRRYLGGELGWRGSGLCGS